MSLEQSIKRRSCCLAIMQNLQTAGLACLDLHLENLKGLAVSILNKPEGASDCSDFFRIKSIGTIICRGSVARTLKQQSVLRDSRSWEMGDLLVLIGVPAHHENIYDHALRSGLVVLVLQGDGNPLRQGRYILEKISLRKPVLYLV